MSFSAATLLLPTPDSAWSLWKPREERASEELESPADWSGGGKPVIGLPATACRTMGLILPMADHEVMAQVVETRLERLGLRGQDGQLRPHRWHLVGQSASIAQVSVDVLAEPFPEHLLVDQAADYVAALRLSKLPEHRLVLTAEHSEWVLAFGVHGKLFHSHRFTPSEHPEQDIAREVMLTELTLESMAPGLGIEGVTVVGPIDLDPSALETALGSPVETLEGLPRSSEIDLADHGPLLPVAVQERRAHRARMAKVKRATFFGAMLYLALAFLGFAYLRFHERTVTNLEEEVAVNSGPASRVSQTAERWKTLSPVLDQNRFPMVLMAEVTSLLPPSGIVIREFESDLDDLELRGEARDAQLAYQFLEDVEAHRILGRYEWSMPQPSVREGTASFRMQGKLK